jgi:hypothetical protein
VIFGALIFAAGFFVGAVCVVGILCAIGHPRDTEDEEQPHQHQDVAK